MPPVDELPFELKPPATALRTIAFVRSVRAHASTDVTGSPSGPGALGQTAEMLARRMGARSLSLTPDARQDWLQALLARYRLADLSYASPYMHFLRWLRGVSEATPTEATVAGVSPSLPLRYPSTPARPVLAPAATPGPLVWPLPSPTATGTQPQRAEAAHTPGVRLPIPDMSYVRPSRRALDADTPPRAAFGQADVIGSPFVRPVPITPQTLNSTNVLPMVLRPEAIVARAPIGETAQPSQMRSVRPEVMAEAVAGRAEARIGSTVSAGKPREAEALFMPLSLPPVPLASWLGVASPAPGPTVLEAIPGFTQGLPVQAALILPELPKMPAEAARPLPQEMPAQTAFASLPRLMVAGQLAPETITAPATDIRTLMSRPVRATVADRTPNSQALPSGNAPSAGEPPVSETPASGSEEPPAHPRSALAAAHAAFAVVQQWASRVSLSPWTALPSARPALAPLEATAPQRLPSAAESAWPLRALTLARLRAPAPTGEPSLAMPGGFAAAPASPPSPISPALEARPATLDVPRMAAAPLWEQVLDRIVPMAAQPTRAATATPAPRVGDSETELPTRVPSTTGPWLLPVLSRLARRAPGLEVSAPPAAVPQADVAPAAIGAAAPATLPARTWLPQLTEALTRTVALLSSVAAGSARAPFSPTPTDGVRVSSAAAPRDLSLARPRPRAAGVTDFSSRDEATPLRPAPTLIQQLAARHPAPVSDTQAPQAGSSTPHPAVSALTAPYLRLLHRIITPVLSDEPDGLSFVPDRAISLTVVPVQRASQAIQGAFPQERTAAVAPTTAPSRAETPTVPLAASLPSLPLLASLFRWAAPLLAGVRTPDDQRVDQDALRGPALRFARLPDAPDAVRLQQDAPPLAAPFSAPERRQPTPAFPGADPTPNVEWAPPATTPQRPAPSLFQQLTARYPTPPSHTVAERAGGSAPSATAAALAAPFLRLLRRPTTLAPADVPGSFPGEVFSTPASLPAPREFQRLDMPFSQSISRFGETTTRQASEEAPAFAGLPDRTPFPTRSPLGRPFIPALSAALRRWVFGSPTAASVPMPLAFGAAKTTDRLEQASQAPMVSTSPAGPAATRQTAFHLRSTPPVNFLPQSRPRDRGTLSPLWERQQRLDGGESSSVSESDIAAITEAVGQAETRAIESQLLGPLRQFLVSTLARVFAPVTSADTFSEAQADEFPPEEMGAAVPMSLLNLPERLRGEYAGVHRELTEWLSADEMRPIFSADRMAPGLPEMIAPSASFALLRLTGRGGPGDRPATSGFAQWFQRSALPLTGHRAGQTVGDARPPTSRGAGFQTITEPTLRAGRPVEMQVPSVPVRSGAVPAHTPTLLDRLAGESGLSVRQTDTADLRVPHRLSLTTPAGDGWPEGPLSVVDGLMARLPARPGAPAREYAGQAAPPSAFGGLSRERLPVMSLPSRSATAVADAPGDPLMIQRVVTGGAVAAPPQRATDASADRNQEDSGDGGGGDVDSVAQEVYTILKRRLANEASRFGRR